MSLNILLNTLKVEDIYLRRVKTDISLKQFLGSVHLKKPLAEIRLNKHLADISLSKLEVSVDVRETPEVIRLVTYDNEVEVSGTFFDELTRFQSGAGNATTNLFYDVNKQIKFVDYDRNIIVDSGTFLVKTSFKNVPSNVVIDSDYSARNNLLYVRYDKQVPIFRTLSFDDSLILANIETSAVIQPDYDLNKKIAFVSYDKSISSTLIIGIDKTRPIEISTEITGDYEVYKAVVFAAYDSSVTATSPLTYSLNIDAPSIVDVDTAYSTQKVIEFTDYNTEVQVVDNGKSALIIQLPLTTSCNIEQDYSVGEGAKLVQYDSISTVDSVFNKNISIADNVVIDSFYDLEKAVIYVNYDAEVQNALLIGVGTTVNLSPEVSIISDYEALKIYVSTEYNRNINTSVIALLNGVISRPTLFNADVDSDYGLLKIFKFIEYDEAIITLLDKTETIESPTNDAVLVDNFYDINVRIGFAEYDAVIDVVENLSKLEVFKNIEYNNNVEVPMLVAVKTELPTTNLVQVDVDYSTIKGNQVLYDTTIDTTVTRTQWLEFRQNSTAVVDDNYDTLKIFKFVAYDTIVNNTTEYQSEIDSSINSTSTSLSEYETRTLIKFVEYDAEVTTVSENQTTIENPINIQSIVESEYNINKSFSFINYETEELVHVLVGKQSSLPKAINVESTNEYTILKSVAIKYDRITTILGSFSGEGIIFKPTPANIDVNSDFDIDKKIHFIEYNEDVITGAVNDSILESLLPVSGNVSTEGDYTTLEIFKLISSDTETIVTPQLLSTTGILSLSDVVDTVGEYELIKILDVSLDGVVTVSGITGLKEITLNHEAFINSSFTISKV